MLKCLAALFISGIIFSGVPVIAQDTTNFWDAAPSYSKQRGRIVAIGLGSTYVASMTGLYYLWYADYDMGKFHSFDDNDEWLQVDKAGHLGSAYYLGKWGIDLMQWTGMKHTKATVIGGGLGFAFLSTVEAFDGFSNEWGFSSGDMIANAGGTVMAVSQELLWKEQRISIKFSWHPTDLNQYNPDLLGQGFPETMFKDYNGQAYWLSGNIASFLKDDSSFPKWLNIAAGYGADGMLGARDNLEFQSGPASEYKRYRQFYLAPDIDLTKIKTQNNILKIAFRAFGFLKFPAPTLEYNNKNNLKFHWLYF